MGALVPQRYLPSIEGMEARRGYICTEKNGATVQHPWVQTPGEIELARITDLLQAMQSLRSWNWRVRCWGLMHSKGHQMRNN